jgi:selenide,water dikinase
MKDKNTIRLTELVAAAGCAAKMGPRDLCGLLGGLTASKDPRMLVGPHTMDDAAVIKLNDEEAICFTTDFITPLVDDPYEWGRIAATNAISDVYAMGGTPLAALNILCWSNCLPKEMLTKVLEGGAAAAKAADCIVAGGHSVQDKEPKYGMAVIGTVHPDRFVKNCGARSGDILYLTKPLGTGVLCTAIKAGAASEDEKRSAISSMTTLNRAACEVSLLSNARAMTDVTEDPKLGASVNIDCLPIMPGMLRLIEAELVPGGAFRNRDAFAERVDFSPDVIDKRRIIVFDPQTSGGILAAIPKENTAIFEKTAKEHGVSAAKIGEFNSSGRISVIATK